MEQKGVIRDSKFSAFEGIVQLRIQPGSDLLKAIQEGVKKHGVKSGLFLSGLGALEKAVLRNLRVFPDKYPVAPEHRLYYEVKKPLELLSLSGWIGEKPDGDAEIHAHFSASYVDGDKVVGVGGHLIEGTIASIKVVIAIGVLPQGAVATAFDEKTQSLDIDLSGPDLPG
jgi:predicted DNA-binding protein with PD1-like motif